MTSESTFSIDLENTISNSSSESEEPKTSAPSKMLNVTLSNLPEDVIELILHCFSYGEISYLRGICRKFRDSCGRLLRVAVRRLETEIDVQLGIFHQELLATNDPDNLLVRVPLLRCYNVLEVLRAEVRLMNALCRKELTSSEQCFPAGCLLDHYFSVLEKVKSRDVLSWSNVVDITTNVQRLNKQFIDSYIHEYYSAVKFGVRILDLLDILIDSDFNVTVTYDSNSDTCNVIGEYIGHSKLIYLPPELTLDGRGVNAEEVREITFYLVNMVCLNNKLLLHDEQYWREMEAVRKTQQELQQQGYALSPASRSGFISLQPREYSTIRICRERCILSDDGFVISETYRQRSRKRSSCNGIKCRINLTCPINESPLEILKNWHKLRLEIIAGNSLEFKGSNDETVNISEYLELPGGRRACFMNAAFASEHLVSVHFPVAQVTSRPDSSVIRTAQKIDTVISGQFSSSSITPDTYKLDAEISVLMQNNDLMADAPRLVFWDGNQDVQETEIRTVSL